MQRLPTFCFVIPSYNNEAWCLKCLASCASQQYPHWSLIYIDDASTDRTGPLVEQYVRDHDLASRCTVIRNTTRQGALANLYHAIHSLDPHTIVVDLDGDDWLPHDRVLTILASVYEDPNIWLTYGTPQTTQRGRKGYGRPIPEHIVAANAFRIYPGVTDHIRTFYAGLFQRIRKRDLMWRGRFLPMTSDHGMMTPMLEMASKGHFKHIAQPLYVYNIHNPLNDQNVNIALQTYLGKYINSLRPYKPIKRLFSERESFLHVPFWQSMLRLHGQPGEQQLAAARRLFVGADIERAEEAFASFRPTAMRSIPAILHFIWLGSPPPPHVRAAVRAWKRMHPGWEVRLWRDRDVAAIEWPTKRLQAAFEEATSWAEKADLLRYAILAQHGGVYLDTDFLCVRPLDALLTGGLTFFAGFEFGHPVADQKAPLPLTNALMGAARGSAIPEECLRRYRTAKEAPDMDLPARSGPGVIGRVCHEAWGISGERMLLLPCSYLYPLPLGARDLPPADRDNFICPESMAVHLWQASWK